MCSAAILQASIAAPFGLRQTLRNVAVRHASL